MWLRSRRCRLLTRDAGPTGCGQPCSDILSSLQRIRSLPGFKDLLFGAIELTICGSSPVTITITITIYGILPPGAAGTDTRGDADRRNADRWIETGLAPSSDGSGKGTGSAVSVPTRLPKSSNLRPNARQ